MNLHQMLMKRAAGGKPPRGGLIGAGKLGAMYLPQLPRPRGVQLVGIADLSRVPICNCGAKREAAFYGDIVAVSSAR